MEGLGRLAVGALALLIGYSLWRGGRESGFREADRSWGDMCRSKLRHDVKVMRDDNLTTFLVTPVADVESRANQETNGRILLATR
jgi:hypothetical protein